MDDRQLIADLLSALEYHTEQTRPIEFSKVAIQAAREYLQKPTQQEPVAWEQFYPDIGKPQIEQPKVRTGDCLLVGVCASEGHKIQKAQPEQEPVEVDQSTMELAESVGLIGPTSRTHDLHQAIQRFHDLICVNAAVKAAQMAADVIRKFTPPKRKFVGLKDEELSEVYNQADWDTVNSWGYERAIEAKLKEKNG